MRINTTEILLRLWSENLKERSYSEDLGADERIIFEWTLGKLGGGGGVDWMQMAQDRDQWWALVNTVMNLRVP
jgi:hypothetical protein